MNYCENCAALQEGEKCTNCKSKKKTVPVKEADIVLLGSVNAFTADMIEPILKDENIPYIRKGKKGSALTAYAGTMGEIVHFYVAYPLYNQAMELIFPFLEEKVEGKDEETLNEE